MSDETGKEEVQELDEIDKFLATLPSLQITEDMIESDIPKYVGKPAKKITVTSVFAILAWAFLLAALLLATRAFPQRGTVFNTIFDTSHYAGWNTQYLFTPMLYLFGNCAVCIGGLCICLIKKMKMAGGAALSLWIAGGLSAVAAVVMLVMQ